VWDDFLPIYTLLRIFNLFADDGYRPLLLRYVIPGAGMWATCDMNAEKKAICRSMYRKFLPLFGLLGDNFTTTEDFVFQTNQNKSTLVCAAQGAAGLGYVDRSWIQTARMVEEGLRVHAQSRTGFPVV
jgi:hypothetical protein